MLGHLKLGILCLGTFLREVERCSEETSSCLRVEGLSELCKVPGLG